MLINKELINQSRVKFISYTGKYPCLCHGLLTLEINGKIYEFGNPYIHKSENLLGRFWESGGSCDFGNGYSESYINEGEWIIDIKDLPEELRQYASEIDEVFNENVPRGCCGGCL